MAAVKWIFVAVFSLAALGALGLGLTASPSRAATLATPPAIALRTFPAGAIGAVAAAPSAPAKAAEPEKTPEPAKTPEPVAAKPEPVAAKPAEPVAAKPEPVAAKPEPVAAKPEPVAAKPAEPAEPVAAKPAPAPAPVAAKPPPAAAAEGMLNLRASDTADVYLDGRKVGGSPVMGVKAKVGNHKVRFDCYDAAGNTVSGPVQTVAVKADAEVEVEFTCPTE